jgi:hypothetical protein
MAASLRNRQRPIKQRTIADEPAVLGLVTRPVSCSVGWGLVGWPFVL